MKSNLDRKYFDHDKDFRKKLYDEEIVQNRAKEKHPSTTTKTNPRMYEVIFSKELRVLRTQDSKEVSTKESIVIEAFSKKDAIEKAKKLIQNKKDNAIQAIVEKFKLSKVVRGELEWRINWWMSDYDRKKFGIDVAEEVEANYKELFGYWKVFDVRLYKENQSE